MNDNLRGNPLDLRQDVTIEEGYFGRVWNVEAPDLYATSLPTMVFDVAGHMSLEIPVLVPTLTEKEIIHLVDGGQPTWGIIEKAKRHAEKRLKSAQGSVFAQPGEQQELPTR